MYLYAQASSEAEASNNWVSAARPLFLAFLRKLSLSCFATVWVLRLYNPWVYSIHLSSSYQAQTSQIWLIHRSKRKWCGIYRSPHSFLDGILFPLTDNNGPRLGYLITIDLDAKPLTSRITTFLCTTGSFLVCRFNRQWQFEWKCQYIVPFDR